MSELKIISPLLDGLTVEKELGGHNGQVCYALRQQAGSERFVLKILSLPSSESKVQALLLSGAYPDEAAVHSYYSGVAEDLRRELEAGKQLAESGRFCGAVGYQIEPRDSGVGFDVYILYPRYVPLSSFLYENAITHLRAVNLGIDLCDALAVCRDAGYLFENIKPENVFLTQTGRFLLGDLGLASLEDLQYASVPEEYLGPYSAPELSDIAASPNPTMDLYAVGMLLYRIYNGNHGPFEDENTGEAMAEKLRLTGKPMPTPIFADYELASIILKACAAHPGERFQTPGELKQALMLYMQRNHVSDTLIAPPIVAPAQPIAADAEPEAEEDAPARMTDVESLDDDFKKSFAPDLSGSGTAKDVDPTLAAAPKAETEPDAAPAPVAVPIPAGDAPAPEAADPDQIDLDAFLASISEELGDDPAAETAVPAALPEEPAAEPDRTYVDEEPKKREPRKKKKKAKSGKAGLTLILIALILAIAAVAFFLVRWYFVEVTALGTKEGTLTTSQVTIRMETKDDPDEFIVTCSDQYGNTYPVTVSGSEYTFTGLTENTAYTVWVQAAERHRLTSASIPSYSFTTPESTQIVEFTAQFGEVDGEVLLNLVHEGPAPAQWQLHYIAEDDSHEDTVRFADTSVRISGLQLNKVYIFTLENADNVFLSGALQTSFEVLPMVQASGLNVSAINGKTVTLSWQSGANSPAQWTVTCTAPGQEPTVQTVTETTCDFQVSSFDQDYTFTVEAPGMTIPAQLVLPANPIVVDSMQAELQEDGSVVVSWEATAGTPAGGWYVSCGVEGSVHDPSLLEAAGNSLTLSGLIPNATYVFTLQPADGSSVFGLAETTVTTPEAERFDDYGVKSSTTFYSLWPEPEKANWNYTDLRGNDTYFNVDDSLVVCLQVETLYASDDMVDVLYVVRNAEGTPVTDASDTLPWDDLWYSRRHASVFPNPGEVGDYTLEIYINGMLLVEIDFHII